MVVTVHVLAAEGKKKKKKTNKRAGGNAGVEGVEAGDDVVVDDIMVDDDIMFDDDVMHMADNDIMVDDDVQAGEGVTIVVVADEGKKKENKRVGSDVKDVVAGEGLGEAAAGKKRKKPSWEYVPIVAEVEEQLPPKRHRPQKRMRTLSVIELHWCSSYIRVKRNKPR